MPRLNLAEVPVALHGAAAEIEVCHPAGECVLQVPGVIGWALHRSLRSRARPHETHVCASTYDTLEADLPRSRAAQLFHALPQQQAFIGLAGLPAQVEVSAALALLDQWCTRERGRVSPIRAPSWSCEVYRASPIFSLYSDTGQNTPVALAEAMFQITEVGTKVGVHVELGRFAVHPMLRGRGLGHLLVLESSRWLGALARNVRLDGHRPVQLEQSVTTAAVAQDGSAAHLNGLFHTNYSFFAVTDELIENARRERTLGMLAPCEERFGHSAIVSHRPANPGTSDEADLDSLVQWL